MENPSSEETIGTVEENGAEGQATGIDSSNGEDTVQTGGTEEAAGEGESAAEENSDSASELEALQREVDFRTANLAGTQKLYDSSVEAYETALSRAESDLAECKAMVARELPVFRETYETRVKVNEENESQAFSDEEVAQALADYNDWQYYYDVVTPATLDDVRAQGFPAYFANLNDCGSQLVQAESDMALYETLLAEEKQALADAQAALAAAQ